MEFMKPKYIVGVKPVFVLIDLSPLIIELFIGSYEFSFIIIRAEQSIFRALSKL